MPDLKSKNQPTEQSRNSTKAQGQQRSKNTLATSNRNQK